MGNEVHLIELAVFLMAPLILLAVWHYLIEDWVVRRYIDPHWEKMMADGKLAESEE